MYIWYLGTRGGSARHLHQFWTKACTHCYFFEIKRKYGQNNKNTHHTRWVFLLIFLEVFILIYLLKNSQYPVTQVKLEDYSHYCLYYEFLYYLILSNKPLMYL